MLLDLLTALQNLEPVAALRASRWVYPLVNTAHVVGIALLVGAIAPLDLRLLGLWRGVPLHLLARVLQPVAVAAASAIDSGTISAVVMSVRTSRVVVMAQSPRSRTKHIVGQRAPYLVACGPARGMHCSETRTACARQKRACKACALQGQGAVRGLALTVDTSRSSQSCSCRKIRNSEWTRRWAFLARVARPAES